MIELLCTICICATLCAILVQDYRERMVYVALYIILAALCFGFQAYRTSFLQACLNSLMNLMVVGIVSGVALAYARIGMKRPLSDAFGLGDLFFFCAAACMFNTISFIVLFAFSLVFSLALHLFLKKKQAFGTVPLAGYMSLFYCCIYAASWISDVNFVFAY